jgi:hypothetical protein
MELTSSVQKQISRFAIAAVAIVAVLSLASLSEAQIVYHKLNIVVNEGSYYLDLNGLTQFTITSEIGTHTACEGNDAGALLEAPAAGNGAIVGPLTAGDEIGPSQTFTGDSIELEGWRKLFPHCIAYWSGTWCSSLDGSCKPLQAYLGLSFQLDGETHYGWAELSIPEDSISTTLNGVAYETTPGVAIAAGQTQ